MSSSHPGAVLVREGKASFGFRHLTVVPMPRRSRGGCAMRVIQAPELVGQLPAFHLLPRVNIRVSHLQHSNVNLVWGEMGSQPSRQIRPLSELLALGKFSASRCLVAAQN